jgi:putative ABC transport system permease protein
VVGRLAQQNASRNPRRTGSTASTLMICMGAVTLILVVVASIQASIDDLVDRRFVGDFVVSSGEGFTGEGIPPEVTDQLNALPEVDAAAGVRFGLAEIDGVGQGVAGVDPEQAFRLYDIGVADGDVTALGADGIAVYEQVAADNGWRVGDSIPVRFAETGVQTFRVTALTETEELLGPFVIGSEAFDANLDVPGDAQVLVRLADGVDAAAGRAAIEPIVAPYPSVELQDLGEFKAATRAQFDPLLVGVFALLALTVVVAVIGMVNTLVLSVVERTREIGLLRAVGASRGQVRATIRWEALLIAGFGVVAALGTGVVFGRVVVQALADEGFTTFAVPVEQLVGVALVTAALSLAASVFPAIWAGRRSVLEAIATE